MDYVNWITTNQDLVLLIVLAAILLIGGSIILFGD